MPVADIAHDDDTPNTLVRHFRCVAFAALSADVPIADLREALAVAESADKRRRDALVPPRRRWLRLVR